MAQQAVRRSVIPTRSAQARPPGQISGQRTRRSRLLPLLVALVIILFWHLQTRDNVGVSFVIASPQAVIEEFFRLLARGDLLRHVGTTLTEIGIGFTTGVSAAFVLGYGIARNRLLEQLLGPYAVGFQAVPIIAIAPILIRFFGPGIPTTSVICALIVFFPMLVSTIVGMRSIDPDLRDLMRSLMATRWQIFTRLEVPAALPPLFGGLKIAATLAVVGTVVGEALGSTAGLGFLIYASRFVYNPAGVLVGVFTLTALALLLYEIVARIERRMLAWRNAGY